MKEKRHDFNASEPINIPQKNKPSFSDANAEKFFELVGQPPMQNICLMFKQSKAAKTAPASMNEEEAVYSSISLMFNNYKEE